MNSVEFGKNLVSYIHALLAAQGLQGIVVKYAHAIFLCTCTVDSTNVAVKINL